MKITEQNIPDLTDKIVVVTGANSGIGFAATMMLAKKNATIILACRNQGRCELAFDKIINEAPSAKLITMPLDVSSFASIHKFADNFKSKFNKLDILLNNAGIMQVPYGLTVDGLEQVQGVNHFGHFLLTNLLFDKLKNSNDARVVNVSSIAHRFGTMNFKKLLFPEGKGYKAFIAYGRSKLQNLLFTRELAKKVEAKELPIKVVATHPGIAKTNLGSHIHETRLYKFFSFLTKGISHDAYDGGLVSAWACTDPNAINGSFYGPDRFFGFKGSPKVCKSTRRSKNEKDMKQLWEVSETYTKQSFEVK